MTTSTNASATPTPATALGSTSGFEKYDSQLPIDEITGTRIVTCCYKQTAAMKLKGTDARSNVYVRIPTGHITEDAITEAIAEVAPFIVAYFRGVEDESIRSYHKAGGQQVYTDTLSLSKVLGILEETGNGGSIDSEQITSWFTETMATELTEVLCAKLDCEVSALTGDSLTKVTAVINGYLAAFISLASGKTTMLPAQRDRLTKAMEICGVEDTVMGQRFTKRFTKMAEKEAEALTALGDFDI